MGGWGRGRAGLGARARRGRRKSCMHGEHQGRISACERGATADSARRAARGGAGPALDATTALPASLLRTFGASLICRSPSSRSSSLFSCRAEQSRSRAALAAWVTADAAGNTAVSGSSWLPSSLSYCGPGEKPSGRCGQESGRGWDPAICRQGLCPLMLVHCSMRVDGKHVGTWSQRREALHRRSGPRPFPPPAAAASPCAQAAQPCSPLAAFGAADPAPRAPGSWPPRAGYPSSLNGPSAAHSGRPGTAPRCLQDGAGQGGVWQRAIDARCPQGALRRYVPERCCPLHSAPQQHTGQPASRRSSAVGVLAWSVLQQPLQLGAQICHLQC